MTDYEAESQSKFRAPRDAFEVELFRRVIQDETRRWYTSGADEIRITIGEEPDDLGRYDLHVWEPSGDILQPLDVKGEMRGTVWLGENEHPVSERYRVQVWHHVEEHEPNHGAPPIPRWRGGT